LPKFHCQLFIVSFRTIQIYKKKGRFCKNNLRKILSLWTVKVRFNYMEISPERTQRIFLDVTRKDSMELL